MSKQVEKKELVLVICRDGFGEPSTYMVDLMVTEEDIERGDHIEMAEEYAHRMGYQGPYISFDSKNRHKLEYSV